MQDAALSAEQTSDPCLRQRPGHIFWLRRVFSLLLPAVSILYLILMVSICIAGPERVAGFDPEATNYDVTYHSPSQKHLAGTDALGRDMAARLIQGGRISLKIALAASCISLLLGVTIGGLSGYIGGIVDSVIMRIVDVLYGVPTILIVIMLMIYLEQGMHSIYIAIGITYWLSMARLTRAQVMSIKHREFVDAARALGVGTTRILLRHVLPNTIGVILVALTLFIPEAIFLEAFLSYVGLGVPAPDASWGTLAADGARNLRAAPYLMLYPAGVICITMLTLNIAGDWLSDRTS